MSLTLYYFNAMLFVFIIWFYVWIKCESLPSSPKKLRNTPSLLWKETSINFHKPDITYNDYCFLYLYISNFFPNYFRLDIKNYSFLLKKYESSVKIDLLVDYFLIEVKLGPSMVLFYI